MRCQRAAKPIRVKAYKFNCTAAQLLRLDSIAARKSPACFSRLTALRTARLAAFRWVRSETRHEAKELDEARRMTLPTNRLTPISPPLVKGVDLLCPVVESRRRATASDNPPNHCVPFRAVFVSRAGFHPGCGDGPNTY